MKYQDNHSVHRVCALKIQIIFCIRRGLSSEVFFQLWTFLQRPRNPWLWVPFWLSWRLSSICSSYPKRTTSWRRIYHACFWQCLLPWDHQQFWPFCPWILGIWQVYLWRPLRLSSCFSFLLWISLFWPFLLFVIDSLLFLWFLTKHSKFIV